MNDDEAKILHKEFKSIFKEIKKADRIVIFRHEMPDFDALGTQMGLYTWLRQSFPQKDVHYIGEGMRAFIPRIFPEPQKLDDAYFKTPYLAIIVDTSNMDRVSLENADLKGAYKVIKFDHHPNVEHFGDLVSVHDNMSSCSELISLFIESMGANSYPLSKDAAKYFYIGMVGDSGRFMYPDTTPMTLRLAADLIQTGLDITSIYNQMYYTTMKELNFHKWVLDNYHITAKGTCYYVLTDADLKTLDIEVGDGKLHINTFRNVEGVKAVISVTEDKTDGIFRVSFRSAYKAVSKVAEQFEGGGHLFAAGGKLKSLDDLPRLLKALDDLEEERK